MNVNKTSQTPLHLWIVGVLALLWNAVGAFDYLMTQTKNASYMEQFTPEQLAYFYDYPSWIIAAWAVAVWIGVLGSILLLLRKSWAVTAYLVSLVGLIVSTLYSYVFTDGYAIMGGIGPALFSALIFVIAVALYIYADRMKKSDVLT